MDRREAIKNIGLTLGYTASMPAVMSVLSSCTSTPAGEIYTPAAMSSQQMTAFENILDVILPTTSTPGAKELNIVRFADAWIDQQFDEEDKTLFTTAQDRFPAIFEQRTGVALDGATPEQIDGYLSGFYAERSEEDQAQLDEILDGDRPEEAGANQDLFDEHRYMGTLKWLGIMGYFSHETIGENHLAYDPIPGPYQGCVDLSEISDGKSWSLGW